MVTIIPVSKLLPLSIFMALFISNCSDDFVSFTYIVRGNKSDCLSDLNRQDKEI